MELYLLIFVTSSQTHLISHVFIQFCSQKMRIVKTHFIRIVATAILEKALEIYQKILPPNHRKLGTAYNNIGSVYWKMGEHGKALEIR